MDPQQPPLPPSGGRNYEFDPEQNKTIKGLGAEMRWVAAPLLVFGVLYIFVAIGLLAPNWRQPAAWFSALYVGVVAALMLSLARWTKEAGVSFELVAGTQGNDIGLLMNALENLRKKYSLLAAFVKIYVAIVLVSLVAMGIAAFMGAFNRP